MDKFFTRNGDEGYTGLLGGGKLPKFAPRIETIGALDEADAAIGLARSLSRFPMVRDILAHVQRDLSGLMGEVAAVAEHVDKFLYLKESHIQWLEEQIGLFGSAITHPDEFIIPGDTPAGGALDVARTMVRRAERQAAALYHSGELQNKEVLGYLNRLSSLIYVLELYEIQSASPDQVVPTRTFK
jgi:cob(I)alamin adenosyltransferase